MADKDVISKAIIKRIGLDMARLLLHLNVEDIELIETQHQRVEERRADLVAKAYAENEQYILHLEIQNANDKLMAWRMLRYRTDVGLSYPQWSIRQYVIYIGKAKLTIVDGLSDEGLDYRYHLINMHEQNIEQFLQQDIPDALVLAILADFGVRPKQEVVRYILSRLQELTQNNPQEFGNYLLMLEILSSNRDLETLVKQEATMLSQLKYTDLPLYKTAMLQGLEQGLERGLEKGLEQGLEKGQHKKSLEIAQQLLKMNFSLAQITEITKLPEEEIIQLQS